MDTRAARLARAAVTASVSALVTAVSHAAAGGDVPHPALLLVAFALALVFCLALTGRRMSPSRLVVAVTVSQALLHAVFAMAGPPPAALLMAATGSQGLTGAHDAAGMGHATGMVGTTGIPGHHASPELVAAATHAVGVDAGMLVAHVIAGTVTALALALGERAFWGTFDSLRMAGAALLRFVTVAGRVPALGLPKAALVIAGSVFRPRPRERLMLALRHRGPPVVAA